MSAARQTGISPPTKTVKLNTDSVIIHIRIKRGKLRIKRERNMISIIIFPPLTTIICISHEALRCSFSSELIAFLCHKRMPERIEYPEGGNKFLRR
jgi:hypothetical protein